MSENEKEKYSEFNELAHKFLSVMEKTFPDENKITLYRVAFETIMKCNLRKPVEMFMENLSPFGVQIMGKDEKFFKKDQYVNEVENLSGKMGLIQYWDSLNNFTKESIWDYMQGLYVLGMRALDRIDELKYVLSIVNN